MITALPPPMPAVLKEAQAAAFTVVNLPSNSVLEKVTYTCLYYGSGFYRCAYDNGVPYRICVKDRESWRCAP